MFSFLNTLEILPVEQVNFIARALQAAELDAAILLKAKTGMPGFISLNAWVANREPICRSIETEMVCCADRRDELNEVLRRFVEETKMTTVNAYKPVQTAAFASRSARD